MERRVLNQECRDFARRFGVGAILLATIGTSASHAEWVMIDLSPYANARIQDYQPEAASFPEGEVTLVGVPFNIQLEGGNNAWNAEVVPGPYPHILEVPIEVDGVTEVHTLINTFYGQPGPESYITLEFFGSEGAYHRKDLIGDEDVRDHLESYWTNSINGTTTINVFSTGGGLLKDNRLDKQQIVLPEDFSTQVLTTMRLTSTGGVLISDASIQGLTVWQDGNAACNGDNADVNGDGVIDPLDSGYVLARLGCAVSACEIECAMADVNLDETVDPLDVGYILSRFGCVGDSQEQLLGAPVFNPVGMDPLRACVGDFNGDRAPDFVVPNHSSSNVTLIFTDGQGGVSGTETYEASLSPTSCAASDFDQDGDDDFVVSHFSVDDLSFFQNDGTGNFIREVLPNSNSAQAMIAGDWNGDSLDDLALTTSNTSADWVWVYLNDGDGGFVAPVLYSVAKAPGALAAGDFDLDGDLDLVVTNSEGYSARILENQGEGAFVLSNATYPLSDYAPFVAVGDLDGDEAPDLAIGGFFSLSVSIWLNDGIGSFSQCTTLVTDGIRIDGGALGDVDGDGDGDLWVSHSGDGADALSLFLNHGNGAMTRELEFGAGARPGGVLPYDLDSDGDLDAIVSNIDSDDVSVHLNQTWAP